jgi:thiosulfate/3-mercaptopyruvate sulfurtransferase
MPFSTLMSTSELAAHLGDPAWAIVDCRFDLQNADAGEQQYRDGHIPGAVYAHLGRDLAGPKTGANGRHPLPSPETFAATLGRWGIGPGVQVVVYDQQNGMFAARLWWMLRASGHDAVAVLNGGIAAWQREGRPLQTGDEHRTPTTFTGRLARERWMTGDEVAALVGDGSHVLIDARSPERYQGLVEPIDPRAGHIPGATNHYYADNLSANGQFRDPAELRALFAETADTPASDIICYCGSGVSACHNLLALEIAGRPGARLYVGSWSEWSTNPDREAETGA